MKIAIVILLARAGLVVRSLSSAGMRDIFGSACVSVSVPVDDEGGMNEYAWDE